MRNVLFLIPGQCHRGRRPRLHNRIQQTHNRVGRHRTDHGHVRRSRALVRTESLHRRIVLLLGLQVECHRNILRGDSTQGLHLLRQTFVRIDHHFISVCRADIPRQTNLVARRQHRRHDIQRHQRPVKHQFVIHAVRIVRTAAQPCRGNQQQTGHPFAKYAFHNRSICLDAMFVNIRNRCGSDPANCQ